MWQFPQVKISVIMCTWENVWKKGYYSFEVGFELSSPTSIVLTLEPRAEDSSPKCQFGLEVAKRSGCRTLAVLTIELLNSLRSRTTLKIHFGLDTTSETSASSPYFGWCFASREPPLSTHFLPHEDCRPCPLVPVPCNVFNAANMNSRPVSFFWPTSYGAQNGEDQERPWNEPIIRARISFWDLRFRSICQNEGRRRIISAESRTLRLHGLGLAAPKL